MSYSILIKQKEKSTIEVLFSTKSFYENYWLELSSKLNLSLIPEFQYGIEIEYGELEELLIEFSEIKKHLINKVPNNEYEQKILKRIDYIEKEISKIDFDKTKIEQIFIG